MDSSLKPSKDGYIRLPYTVDSQVSKRSFFNSKKVLIGGAMVLVNVLLGASILNARFSLGGVLLFFFLILVADWYILRFAILEERHFRKIKTRLESCDYQFSSSAFWQIYDITAFQSKGQVFHVLSHVGGYKSIVVKFERNTVVGKGEWIEYTHYDGLSEAYNLLGTYNTIGFFHFDVMGSVGEDESVSGLFKLLDNCKNPDIEAMLLQVYDHLNAVTSELYHEYDIYLFYTPQSNIQFLSNMSLVLQAFLRANYVKYSVLDKRSLRDLNMTLWNLPTFSISEACDIAYTNRHAGSNFLRVLWTESGGQRTFMNMTLEEEAFLKQQKGSKAKKRSFFPKKFSKKKC